MFIRTVAGFVAGCIISDMVGGYRISHVVQSIKQKIRESKKEES